MGSEDNPIADAEDRLFRRVLWEMPSGLYIVGAADGERLNGMTLNLAIQVSIRPRRIGIAVAKSSYTRQIIDSSGVFSLNLLARQDKAVVRKFVKPVEVDLEAKTLNGFEYRHGRTRAPILAIAAAWVDCQISQTVDAGDHLFYIGDVVDAGYASEDETFEILRMEDTRMNYGG